MDSGLGVEGPKYPRRLSFSKPDGKFLLWKPYFVLCVDTLASLFWVCRACLRDEDLGPRAKGIFLVERRIWGWGGLRLGVQL